MQALVKDYATISVANTNPAFSIELLAQRDLKETKAFYKEVCSYRNNFDISDTAFDLLYCHLVYAFRYDHNHFICSNTKDNCFIAEIYDAINGTTIIIILKKAAKDKTYLSLFIEVDNTDERAFF